MISLKKFNAFFVLLPVGGHLLEYKSWIKIPYIRHKFQGFLYKFECPYSFMQTAPAVFHPLQPGLHKGSFKKSFDEMFHMLLFLPSGCQRSRSWGCTWTNAAGRPVKQSITFLKCDKRKRRCLLFKKYWRTIRQCEKVTTFWLKSLRILKSTLRQNWHYFSRVNKKNRFVSRSREA